MILILDNYAKNGRVQQIVEAVQQYTNEPLNVISFKRAKENDSSKISCLILSGSAHNLSNKEDEKKYINEIEFIKACQAPVLGICFGHHILGRAYGSKILQGGWIKGEKGIRVLKRNEIFSSWSVGEKIIVNESHRDYVAQLPKGFVLLADSGSCQIEAMKHNVQPLYGIQFHAERTEDGRQVIGNFIKNVVNPNKHDKPLNHALSGDKT